jgi:hypothetical protein
MWRELRQAYLGVLITLIAQFLLGMVTNLFVEIPLFGFRLLVPAIRSWHRPTITTAAIGALAMLGAGFNGGSYLNYHEDFSSMIMASLFAVAVIAYVVGLWALPLQQGSRTQDA